MAIKVTKKELQNSRVSELLNASDDEFDTLFVDYFASTQSLESLHKMISNTTDVETIRRLAKAIVLKK